MENSMFHRRTLQLVNLAKEEYSGPPCKQRALDGRKGLNAVRRLNFANDPHQSKAGPSDVITFKNAKEDQTVSNDSIQPTEQVDSFTSNEQCSNEFNSDADDSDNDLLTPKAGPSGETTSKNAKDDHTTRNDSIQPTEQTDSFTSNEQFSNEFNSDADDSDNDLLTPKAGPSGEMTKEDQTVSNDSIQPTEQVDSFTSNEQCSNEFNSDADDSDNDLLTPKAGPSGETTSKNAKDDHTTRNDSIQPTEQTDSFTSNEQFSNEFNSDADDSDNDLLTPKAGPSGEMTKEDQTVSNDSIQPTEQVDSCTSNEQCSSEFNSDADDSDNDPLYVPENEVTNTSTMAVSSYEDDSNTSDTNITENVTKNRSRKIRQQRKIDRNTGKAYVTESGKQVGERTFHKLTTCRSKCNEKIDEKKQKDIFDTYWRLGTRDRRAAYISGLIMYDKPKSQRKRRMTPDKQKNRQVTFIYKIPSGGLHIQVCRKCFLQVFDESPKFLWTVCQQIQKSPGNAPTPDKRGRHTPSHKISEDRIKIIQNHLDSLPSYESHYCRKESSKKYLPSHLTITEIYKMYCKDVQEPVSYTIYSKMFHESNLSIKKPKKDTCHTCDELKLKLTYAEEDEKAALRERQEQHHKAAEQAFETKRQDKQNAKDCQKLAVCAFDLQQCLPTPCLQTSVAFYKRQLWTFNLTIHNMKDDKVSCFLWYESLARRGANEISSCVFKFLQDLNNDIEHVILYSDSCPGQNKNTPFLAMCIAAVNLTNIKVLEHKFLVPGHSRMECDTDHGKIEKLKKRYHLPISHPHDWAQLIRLAGKKNPFNVIEMTQDNFLNFAMLLKRDIQFKKCNQRGEKFVWQNVKWIRYSKDEPFKFFYKTSLQQEDPFNVMDVSRRGCPNPVLKPDVCYKTLLPICEKKKKDILSLFPYIPPVFHNFYSNIPSGRTVDPIVESEDDD